MSLARVKSANGNTCVGFAVKAVQSVRGLWTALTYCRIIRAVLAHASSGVFQADSWHQPFFLSVYPAVSS